MERTGCPDRVSLGRKARWGVLRLTAGRRPPRSWTLAWGSIRVETWTSVMRRAPNTAAASEIEFFYAPFDQENSVRWRRIASISMIQGRRTAVRRRVPATEQCQPQAKVAGAHGVYSSRIGGTP